jgi:hypothetical protein
VEFRVLGAFEARRDGCHVPVGRPGQHGAAQHRHGENGQRNGHSLS